MRGDDEDEADDEDTGWGVEGECHRVEVTGWCYGVCRMKLQGGVTGWGSQGKGYRMGFTG